MLIGMLALILTGVCGATILLPWAGAKPPSQETPPAIQSRVTPESFRKVLEDREILTRATLEEVAGPPAANAASARQEPLKRYYFQAAMVVRGPLAAVRRAITDYRLYVERVPYVDRAVFNPSTQLLHLEGGIWKWKLQSVLHFEDRGERWVRYRIVGGHFQGLTGDFIFEPVGEKGTAVFLQGELQGRGWPPAFVITRGAEIVFAYTARRMRSYLEDREAPGRPPAAGAPQPGGLKNDGTEVPVPQPRRGFSFGS